MNRYISSRIVACAAAFALLATAANSHAASLGQLTVHSRLGQILSGEIEVTGTADELAGLSARVASADAYRAADVDYDPALRNVRVTVERRGEARAVIHVRSEGAFNVPFADLLIDTRWTGGGITRDFTFLLDLPDAFTPTTVAAPAAPVAAPVMAAKAAPTPEVAPSAASASDTAKPASQAQVASSTPSTSSQPQQAAADGPRNYTTEAGDSLSRVADQFAADSVSSVQMMAAIYKANPKAFANGNADRLKKGATLSVPAAEDAAKISKAEARKTILKVSSGFDAYRKQVATAAKEEAPSDADATRAASGRIKPEVQDESAPERVATGHLRVGHGGVSRKTQQRVEVVEEEIASKSKALEEQNARIQELEATQAQLNKLLTMQQDAASAPAAETSAAETPAVEATVALAATSESAPDVAAATGEQTVAAQTAAPAPQPETTAPVKADAVVMKNARQPDNWYEDPVVQLIVLILCAIAIGWFGYKRYKERVWRKADRELQRARGMPVDESSIMSVA